MSESSTTNNGTTPAPAGQVWVCGACGKRARTRYGFDADNNPTAIDRGWDESCMMNAVLCYEQRSLLTAEWVAVEPAPTPRIVLTGIAGDTR